MNFLASIVAIAALVLLYLFVKRRGVKENIRPDERRSTSNKPGSKFHAVSIKFKNNACEAAKKMEGRRFLSGAAPRIPLPGCDVLECRCRFIHHADRRRGEDRRNPYGQGFGGDSTGSYEAEQRKRGERRDDSPEDFFS
jgi:hypothetical protein